MSLAASSGEPRHTPRESMDHPSHIAGMALALMPAPIINLSPYGCMVRCESAVPLGARLTVDAPEIGRLGGVVIWSRGARIGIEFDTPIPIDDYLGMLGLMKRSPGALPS